jgi:hypothetical protein
MNTVRSILNVLDAINEEVAPSYERQGWWADEDSTSIGLQVYNQTSYRGRHPFVIVNRGNQMTLIWLPTAKGLVEIKELYPNVTIYQAGSERNPQPLSALADIEPEVRSAVATDNDYRASLDNFVGSDEKGLANNPEAVGAITELNQRLSTLGFSATAGSTIYDIKTVNTVKALQQAYNNMYGEQRIKVDGDLGPLTLNVLKKVEDLLKQFDLQTTTTESFKSAIAKYIIKEEVTQITGDKAGELTQTLVALDKFYESATTNGLTINADLQQRLINARLSLATHTIDVTREITPYISTISNGAIERSKEQTATVSNGGEIKVEPEVGSATRSVVVEPEAVSTDSEADSEEDSTDSEEDSTDSEEEPEVVIPAANTSDLSNPRPTENADGDDPYGIINARQAVEAGQTFRQLDLDKGLAELKADQDAWDEANSGEGNNTETNNGTKEYTTIVDAQNDTTLESGDIVIIDGKEAEVLVDSSNKNILYWPGTQVPFDEDDEPPAEGQEFESFNWGTRLGNTLTISTAAGIKPITITKEENGQISMAFGESKYTDVQLTRQGIMVKPRTFSAIRTRTGERKEYTMPDSGSVGRQYATNLLDAFAYVYNNMLDDA